MSELIVSRTDPRGVIQAVNSGFERVSGFAKSDLLGAPHRVIRHPDMPSGVFWLLWDTLQAGRPVAAYVKNRTSAGGYYWVLALVTPLSGGYMSMRFLPDAEICDQMTGIYATLRAKERRQNWSPEQSAGELVTMVNAMGYPSYEAFMVAQFATSQRKRNTQIGRRDNPNVRPLQAIGQSWSDVVKAGDRIAQDYVAAAGISTNLSIQAARLKGTGDALGAVASNFSLLAGEINEGLTGFMASVKSVAAQLDDALFLTCLQELMLDTRDSLADEQEPDPQELQIIQDQVAIYDGLADQAIREVKAQLAKFKTDSRRIQRNLMGLSVTRVMCAIENAQIGDNRTSVAAIIQKLQDFQADTSQDISDVCDCLDGISRHALSIAPMDAAYHHRTAS